MPTIEETFVYYCGADWTAVAGPGQVLLENRDANTTLFWVIGTNTAPTMAAGYGLPPVHGNRLDMQVIDVPTGRQLWIRSARAEEGSLIHPVLLTSADALVDPNAPVMPEPPAPPAPEPTGETSIFGVDYPASQPSDYGEGLLTEAAVALDDLSSLLVQANDPAISTSGGQVATDGASNTSTRWVRQDIGTSVVGEIYGQILEVSASDGSITPTGTIGGMTSGARVGEIANYQAVTEATSTTSVRLGATVAATAAVTIDAIRPFNLTPLLNKPQAIFLQVTQSNWVGNSAGYTRTKHSHVPGAIYVPSLVNRSQGADVDGLGQPYPMLAMEPMQHQTLNAGGGPGAAFCREVRQHLPADHTICYLASGFAGAGFKDDDRWDKDGATPDAYLGFWSAARALWQRAQAWNPNSYIAGLNICVGESDLGGTVAAGNLSEHMTGLNAMIDEIRAEPGWGEMPIMISEIGMEPGAGGGVNDTNIANIRAAQELFATGSGDATFEKTRCVFLPRPAGAAYTDGVHYDEDSNIVRGTLAGKAWHNLAYPTRTPLALTDSVA